MCYQEWLLGADVIIFRCSHHGCFQFGQKCFELRALLRHLREGISLYVTTNRPRLN